MEFLDTRVLVRYLTDDPPKMAERAEALIENAASLSITETVLLETAHVLRSVYGLQREEIVDLLIEFLQKPNIALHNISQTIAVAALELCRPSNRVSFADALIWAAARSSPSEPVTIYSFDERFPDTDIDLRLDF